MSTLIIGCGYLGQTVGAWLTRRGETVHGTVRSPRRAGELSQRGLIPKILDLLQPETLTLLPGVDRILFCVGFDRSSGAERRAVHIDGLRRLLKQLPQTCVRFVYTSSTSVFGQTSGEWVDEGSATEPGSEAGKICLEAEQILGDWFLPHAGTSCVILRFSGLYGPGRTIQRASIERGEPIPGHPTRYLNLVHIDDAAQATVAAMDAPHPAPLYLVSDDRPVTREAYYSLAARLLGAPAPRFDPSRQNERRGDASNRRILNRKMREELGVDLNYPDITSGLPAALGVSPIP